MAETITQITQPPEFIEAAAKPFITELQQAVGGFKGADLSKVYGPQFVAGQDPLQAAAINVATGAQGLGSYAPFLQTAGRLAGEAEATLGGLPTDIATARSTLTGIPSDIAASRGQLGIAAGDIAAARGMIGPSAYQQFMSPYQKDVIDASLKEFDIQSQKGLSGIAQRAIQAGAFGGGREGVQRAEYQSASDRNRAALQAQLLQQGFGQAQQLAQQAQAQRMGVGASQAGLAAQQLGLGQAAGSLAAQQLGVGQAQLGAQMGLSAQQQALASQQQALAGLSPQLAGQQVAGLTSLGGGLQAQRQAELSAQQQLAQQQLQQPITAAQTLGSGITGLIAGYPGGTQQTVQPSASPLQSALGLGATLAGIYRAF